ncbi:MAG: transcriptional repressor [Chloroflexi bacterium]|nr:transcriptional repressor [Chloroflexota bacterium]MBI4198352.1 transcriptional repressor [Chloroflexota bacterium]
MRHTKTLERLKESGYRLTPQRVMVLAALAARPGHIGVDEIYRQVYEGYPYIDVATVYRTLQLLKNLHMVTELDVGGTTRYELIEADRHHHMVCRGCGNAFDFSPTYLVEFRQRLTQEFGFQPDLEHFAIGGLCSRCAESL